jgi:hypothetical protein
MGRPEAAPETGGEPGDVSGSPVTDLITARGSTAYAGGPAGPTLKAQIAAEQRDKRFVPELPLGAAWLKVLCEVALKGPDIHRPFINRPHAACS